MSATSTSPTNPCEFGLKHQPMYSAERIFSRGEGTSSHRIELSVGQFQDEETAKASFKETSDGLAKRKQWTDPKDGTKATISKLSTEKVGDESDAVTVKLQSQGVTANAEFRFVRVGSAIYTANGIGIASAPTEASAAVVRKQAEKLQTALGRK